MDEPFVEPVTLATYPCFAELFDAKRLNGKTGSD
jgi:hypothetical protein